MLSKLKAPLMVVRQTMHTGRDQIVRLFTFAWSNLSRNDIFPPTFPCRNAPVPRPRPGLVAVGGSSERIEAEAPTAAHRHTYGLTNRCESA